MNLKKLREMLPMWIWRGNRVGFGWDYIGRKGNQTVRVYPVAYLSGIGEDDFRTEWMVDTQKGMEYYSTFWLAERVR